jgi:ribose transport system substrate-binding protein
VHLVAANDGGVLQEEREVTHRWKHAGAMAGALIAATLALAACGSSSDDSSSAAGSTTTASAAAASSPGLAAAKAYLAKNTNNPTSIGLPPLAAKPPAGKKIVSLLVSPQPVALRVSNAQAAAAKALGWSYSTVNAGGTQATAVSAFEAALAKHPDAICNCGFPAAYFTKQIRQAKAEGIAVISNTTGDGPIDGIIANVGGAEQEAAYGKLVAAYFVAESDGKGKAVVFNIQAFPILAAFTSSFQDAVKEWCPDCSVDLKDQQLSDIGSKTPQNVASYFQSHPDVKWAVFGNGDLTQGVGAALRTAGVSGVKVVGEAPDEANLKALASGTEAAWAGYPTDILGWATMDALARHFTKSDVAKAVAIPLPGQILTHENIDGAVVDGQGNYQAVAGFEDQFKKLWSAG